MSEFYSKAFIYKAIKVIVDWYLASRVPGILKEYTFYIIFHYRHCLRAAIWYNSIHLSFQTKELKLQQFHLKSIDPCTGLCSTESLTAICYSKMKESIEK